MIVAIHQPNYLPYLGFFEKMIQADIFVIYDDAQFNKEDFQHRNKIKIFHGCKWLTVPVEKKLISLKEITIKNEVMKKGIKWFESHYNNIDLNYNRTPHYSLYKKDMEAIYMKKHEKLIDLNMELIKFLMNAFNIKKKLIYSSELNHKSNSTQRLIDIVESIGGDTYLSGAMGRNYLDLTLFERKGIEVKFQEFKPIVYQQNYEDFLPNMSAIDALFNIGKMPMIDKNIQEF